MVISQKKAVKKKLMAATAMLLIACIMLISASYAWFTLSTAPEVTGITTTVGANGNLEIALATSGIYEADGETIKTGGDATWPSGANVQSNVGSSMSQTSIDLSNITWGNLIDVSNNDYYGLNNIVLMPAELNYQDTGKTKVNTEIMLKTPIYGADGRIETLNPNTSNALYDPYAKKFTASNTSIAGVRAIGTALSMTDRQVSYRGAKSTVTNAKSISTLYAAQSLNQNGSDLATVIMKYATSGADSSYGYDDLVVMDTVVADLYSAYESIDSALDASIIALAASAAAEESLDATEFAAFEDALESATITNGVVSVSVPKGESTETLTYTMPDEWVTYRGIADQIKSDLDEAKALIGALLAVHTEGSENNIPWTETVDPADGDGVTGGLKEILTYIINPDEVTVNGIDANEVTQTDNLNKVVNDVAAGRGVVVALPSGSGVYSDIADFSGDYTAQVTVTNIQYGSLNLTEATARMTTKSSVTTPYLTVLESAVIAAGAPSNKGDEAPVLTDYYGYALDMFFRTNVDNSNLLLQVDEAQRIYSESDNEATQGGGSYMEFTTQSNTFSTDDMLNLMGAIRVVFMKADGTILGTAKLDTRTTDIDATDSVNIPTTVTGSTVKSQLKLYEVVTTTTGNGEDAVTTTTEQFKETQTLTALNKNTPTAITTLVYLDGNYVTNAMVANAETSMTGSLNLQFASSATLTPMANKPLEEGSGNTGTSTETPSEGN